MPTEDLVREQFAPWNTPNPVPFWDILPENMKLTVVGALNPCGGVYNTKAASLEAFSSMASRLGAPPESNIFNVLVSGDYAIVEMTFKCTTKKGNVYDQLNCFVVRYEGNKIVEARVYIDTAVEIAIYDQADQA